MVNLISENDRNNLGIDSLERGLVWATFLLRAAYENDPETDNNNYFNIQTAYKTLLDEASNIYYVQGYLLITAKLEFDDSILASGGNLFAVKELVLTSVSYSGATLQPSSIIKTPVPATPPEVDNLEKYFYWSLLQIQSNKILNADENTSPQDLKQFKQLTPNFNESTQTPTINISLNIEYDYIHYLNSNNLIESMGFETRPNPTNPLNTLPPAQWVDTKNFINSFIPEELHPSNFDFYVDLVNGNDENDGETFANAFLTIDHAIRKASEKRISTLNINIQGIVTNYVFNVGGLSNSGYHSSSYWAYDADQKVFFKGYGTGFIINTNYNDDSQKNLVEGSEKVSVTFENASFTFENNSNCLSFYNQKVSFVNCSFEEPTVSSFDNGFIWTENSDIYIESITVTGIPNSGYCWIAGTKCNLGVGDNCILNDYNLCWLEESVIYVYYSASFTNPSVDNYGGYYSKLIFNSYPDFNNLDINTNINFLRSTPIQPGAILVNSNVRTDIKVGFLNSLSEKKESTKLDFSFEIPANSSNYIRLPNNTRSFHIRESIINLDSSFDISCVNMEELLLFTDNLFSNINGSQDIKSVWINFDFINFTVNTFVGSIISDHNPVDDNSNQLRRITVNYGNGNHLGMVYDNCYSTSLLVNVSGTCVIR